jgi:methyltransferase
MNIIPYAIIAAVAVQRLAEVAWAQANTARLKARGAVEVGAAHYPLIVVMHTAWLIAMVVFLPAAASIHFLLLAIFVVLEFGRGWVLVSLGRYFTTRIITLPGAPLVRKGPYRYIRHPNYLIVCGEILVLPLAFGEIGVAIVFSILNAAMLAWRIRTEDAVLGPRRSAP